MSHRLGESTHEPRSLMLLQPHRSRPSLGTARHSGILASCRDQGHRHPLAHGTYRGHRGLQEPHGRIDHGRRSPLTVVGYRNLTDAAVNTILVNELPLATTHF